MHASRLSHVDDAYHLRGAVPHATINRGGTRFEGFLSGGEKLHDYGASSSHTSAKDIEEYDAQWWCGRHVEMLTVICVISLRLLDKAREGLLSYEDEVQSHPSVRHPVRITT